VTQLFPSAGDRNTFSDAQIQLAQETDSLILPHGYIASILLPSLNRGSVTDVSGWTNAFILDVFTSDTEFRCSLDRCSLLSGSFRARLLLLIPKPADSPLAPSVPGANLSPTAGTLRPLGLPEIFYRLAGRAAVRIERPLVSFTTTAPVQLGVGIPFGCQIGAKGAQCAVDARKAVSTWDGNSAFNPKPRQDTFLGVSDRAPFWAMECCGEVSRWDGVQRARNKGIQLTHSISRSARTPSSVPSVML